MKTGISSIIGDLRPKTISATTLPVTGVLAVPFISSTKDYSSGNKTATLVGGAAISSAQYKYGGSSLYLDGSGDYVSYADSADWNFGTGDFTIQCWIRPTVDDYLCICEQGTASTDYVVFRLRNLSDIQFRARVSGSDLVTGSFYSSGGPITQNVWQHVAVVRYGSSFNIYVNGTSVANVTASPTMPDFAAPLTIGYGPNSGSSDFNGYIQDFNIAKSALYTGNFTPPGPLYQGAVRYVGPNCAYTTIGSAITASSAGDTILVAPGTYTEAITYGVDNLTIKAIGSYLDTTITQTAATVVDFSTKSGCVLDGFTVSITAADGSSDYVFTSNNDDAVDYNIIRNCKLNWSDAGGSALTADWAYGQNGNLELRDCKITLTMSYTGTSDSRLQCRLNSGHTVNIYNCDFTATNASTTALSVNYFFDDATGSTTNVWNSKFSFTSAGKTTNEVHTIRNRSGATLNLYNCDIIAICSDTGLCYGVTAAGTVNSYNNTVSSSNIDADAIAYNVSGTGNIYGGQVRDGSIVGCNLYGSTPALAVSDAQLILNFNGLDAATASYDESTNKHALTYVGNAQLDTAQYKFGASSLLLDGTGDYLTIPDSSSWNLGSGDFTVAFWVRFNSVSGTQSFISQPQDATNWFHIMASFATGRLYIYTVEGGTAYNTYAGNGYSWSTGVWYHLAFVRKSSAIKIYINGIGLTMELDNLGSRTIPDFTGVLRIGADYVVASPGDNLNGWLDSLIWVKGRALYTANFQPPSLPYTAGGYGVRSSGTTGGSGSAASGKNYVNVVVNGTTRKLFYDTTF